jgi:hypothetical protein
MVYSFSCISRSKFKSHFIENSCTWKGRECGPDDFVTSLTDHGVCYTWNRQLDEYAVSSPGTVIFHLPKTLELCGVSIFCGYRFCMFLQI